MTKVPAELMRKRPVTVGRDWINGVFVETPGQVVSACDVGAFVKEGSVLHFFPWATLTYLRFEVPTGVVLEKPTPPDPLFDGQFHTELLLLEEVSAYGAWNGTKDYLLKGTVSEINDLLFVLDEPVVGGAKTRGKKAMPFSGVTRITRTRPYP